MILYLGGHSITTWVKGGQKLSVFVQAQGIKTACISSACFLSNSVCSSNLLSELTISFLLEEWNGIIFTSTYEITLQPDVFTENLIGENFHFRCAQH